MSRTNFRGPKDVRVIEIRLHIHYFIVQSSKVYSLKHKQLIVIIIQIYIQVKNDMKMNRKMGLQ